MNFSVTNFCVFCMTAVICIRLCERRESEWASLYQIRVNEQTQEPANAIKITRLNNFKKSHYAKTKYKHCSNTKSGEEKLNVDKMVCVGCRMLVWRKQIFCNEIIIVQLRFGYISSSFFFVSVVSFGERIFSFDIQKLSIWYKEHQISEHFSRESRSIT